MIVRRVSQTRTLFGTTQGNLVKPDMTAAAREALIHEIERNGHDFIGQEVASLSTAPLWSGASALQAAPIALRVYVAATAKGYQVMPGGLTRIALG